MGGEEVDEAKRPQIKTLLPDPYGRGFSRNEDPLVRTKAIWESQDSNRLLYGKIAGKQIRLFAFLRFYHTRPCSNLVIPRLL